MATLLQALVSGVPTLIDSTTVARTVVSDTNSTTALVSGNFISASGGTIDKADASTSKFAIGYVLAAVLASAAFTYYTDGVNTGVTGMTKGAQVYLSTAGAGTTTAFEPTSGQGWQGIGRAVSTTGVLFVPEMGWTRA